MTTPLITERAGGRRKGIPSAADAVVTYKRQVAQPPPTPSDALPACGQGWIQSGG